ncbi:MAG: ABC transporter permease [Clostridia bacterium]|nr:ABC transporter permease [Clostridia bacterium]
MNRHRRHHLALGLIVFLVYVFLIGPLVIIMASSFGEQAALVFPGQGFTLKWYAQVFQMSSFINSALLSIEIAFAATALALLLGVPAAYALNRFRFPGKGAVKTLFLSPVLIPCIVLGFIMLRYVISQWQLPVIPSLLIGHTLLSIPYVMRVITASLSNFDFAIEEAACSLGATRGYSFFRMVLPNIKSGIASACVMAVINSFNNVSLSTFLTAPGVTMLPIEIMGYVEYHFDPTIAALATVMMLVTLGVMLLIEKTLGLQSVV